MTRRAASGTTTVEFAIIGVAMFMILFGVIEFGRLLFTISTLSEATRRASRVAAVCPVKDPAILNAAMFASLPGLVPANFEVAYLDSAGTVIGAPINGSNLISYVRVRLAGDPAYRHRMVIPFLTPDVTLPPLGSTLPAESLGYAPPPATTAYPACTS